MRRIKGSPKVWKAEERMDESYSVGAAESSLEYTPSGSGNSICSSLKWSRYHDSVRQNVFRDNAGARSEIGPLRAVPCRIRLFPRARSNWRGNELSVSR